MKILISSRNNYLKRLHFFQGFTLIELLIVITIIATLAVTVFVALNPAQRLKSAKDAHRTSDVDTILTAIHTYIIDNGGNFPAGLSSGMSETQISGVAAGSGCGVTNSYCNITNTACVNLAGPLVKYLKSIPVDPNSSLWSSSKTGYSVQVDANSIITVKACGTEGNPIVQTSR